MIQAIIILSILGVMGIGAFLLWFSQQKEIVINLSKWI
jgi:hypothetical protein